MKIKFFRHLKSDWFRYGFETIAVIVGILVAFALENWNDNRKTQIELNEIVLALKNDLVQDTILLSQSIEETKKIHEYNHGLVTRMYAIGATLDTIKKIALTEFSPSIFVLHDLNTTTLRSLESTGKMEYFEGEISTAILKHDLIQKKLQDKRLYELHLAQTGTYSRKYAITLERDDIYVSRLAWDIEDERDFVMQFTNLLEFGTYMLRLNQEKYDEILQSTRELILLLNFYSI
jgi:hypothetical protein